MTGERLFTPFGRFVTDPDGGGPQKAGDCKPGNICNRIEDKEIRDFANLDATDVIGGNSMALVNLELDFPISEEMGLSGLVFVDAGNAFAENDFINPAQFRVGTGAGIQWFSPFGPILVVIGFPLDPYSDEDGSVFEFSLGGQQLTTRSPPAAPRALRTRRAALARTSPRFPSGPRNGTVYTPKGEFMLSRTRSAGLHLGLALALLLPALPAAAEFKLALGDRQRALLSSDKGKEAEKTLSQLQDKKKKELEPRSNQCKKVQEDAESQKFVLSDDAMQEKVIEFQRCQRDLERDVQAAKDEIVVQQQKLLGPLAKKLEEVVTALSREKEFDLVLDRSTPGVLFAPDGLDVTDLVIKRLNGQ